MSEPGCKQPTVVANAFAFLDLHVDPILVASRGYVLWANRACLALLQAEDHKRLCGTPLADVLDLGGERPSPCRSSTEGVAIRSSGVRVAVRVVAQPTGIDDGVVFQLLDGATDVQTKDRFWQLMDRAPIGIMLSEIGERLQYANERCSEIFGVPTDRLLGLGWKDFIAPESLEAVEAAVIEVVLGQPSEFDLHAYDAHGTLHDVRMSLAGVTSRDGASNFIATVVDTTAVRQSERRLVWEATHDPLTRIANRVAFESAAGAQQGPYSVFLLDLNGFKAANDTFGHHSGDSVLKEIARRMTEALQDEAVVARLGGDEFAVLSPGSVPLDHMRRWMAIQECFLRPVSLGHIDLRIGASIGYARGAAGDTPDVLLMRADADMYAHKRRRKESR